MRSVKLVMNAIIMYKIVSINKQDSTHQLKWWFHNYSQGNFDGLRALYQSLSASWSNMILQRFSNHATFSTRSLTALFNPFLSSSLAAISKSLALVFIAACSLEIRSIKRMIKKASLMTSLAISHHKTAGE